MVSVETEQVNVEFTVVGHFMFNITVFGGGRTNCRDWGSVTRNLKVPNNVLVGTGQTVDTGDAPEEEGEKTEGGLSQVSDRPVDDFGGTPGGVLMTTERYGFLRETCGDYESQRIPVS